MKGPKLLHVETGRLTGRRKWQASLPCPCCKVKWNIEYENVYSTSLERQMQLVMKVYKPCKCRILREVMEPMVQEAVAEHANV